MFSGSGPGRQTRDGCSVELYRQLAYLDELDDCVACFGAGLTVLELGCGTGRLTRRIVDWGASVTAVDNSIEMLEAVPAGVTKIHGDIESLDLGVTFDTVLLASGLINHPSPDTRLAFARTARRHLVRGGRLLLQRQDPDWLASATVGSSGKFGAVTIGVERVDRSAVPMTMTLRYELDDDVWRQSFSVVPLSELAVESLLRESGFDSFHWFGRRRLWVETEAVDIDDDSIDAPGPKEDRSSVTGTRIA